HNLSPEATRLQSLLKFKTLFTMNPTDPKFDPIYLISSLLDPQQSIKLTNQLFEIAKLEASNISIQYRVNQKSSPYHHQILKQIKEYEENQKILEAEKNVEYAFSASQNKKADQILKQKIHSEDPMADFFRSKEQKNNKSKAENDTETNNNVYAASVQNRFGIKPGQRWDGVDRSNGFEKRIMNKSNEKIAEINRRYSQSYDL
ncbi:MAG: bud site selection protein, partial [Paramarteilia canceri]